MKLFRNILIIIMFGLSVSCAGNHGNDELLFLVSPKALTLDFWMRVRTGAEAAGEKLGVEILWNGPALETDIAGQIAVVEDHVNMGVDAIVIAACDARALISPLQNAVDVGIPVVTIDSGIDSDLPATFVATDNVEAARVAARNMARLIGGSGKVGLIPHIPGASTSNEREQGFLEQIEAYPDIEVAHVLYSHAQAARGMMITEDMLAATPDLAGIFAANEGGTIGAASALESQGVAGKVQLIGFDSAPGAIDALNRGTVQALIVQNPWRMGYDGVVMAYKTLQGEQVPKRIDTGVTVVTTENLQSPEIQALLNPEAP